MKKNNKGLIICLITIIVILLTLVILLSTGTINFKEQNENTNDNHEILNNKDNENNNYDTKVYDELTKISKLDYNFIKSEYTTDYSIGLSIDGKINVNFQNNISNISNAKDIALFSTPAPYPTLYIVTTNGDVYKYDFSNYESKNYNATKISEYSNIEKIITYRTRKANAGGCDFIILVDKNNKYYKLDSSCL